MIQGKEVLEQTAAEEVEQLSDRSFVTRSTYKIYVVWKYMLYFRSHLELEANSVKDLVVECYGNNEVLGKDSRAYAHIVEILSKDLFPMKQ